MGKRKSQRMSFRITFLVSITIDAWVFSNKINKKKKNQRNTMSKYIAGG